MMRFDWRRYEDTLNILRQYQRWVYALVVMLMSSWIGYQQLMPKWMAYQQVRSQKETFNTTFMAQLKQSKTKNKLQSSLDNLRQALRTSQSRLFSLNEWQAFSITTLPTLVSELSLNLGGISYPASTPINPSVQAHPISLRLTGSYDRIFQLIGRIETFEKLVQVQTIQLRRTSLNPVVLSCELTLTGYTTP